LSTYSRLDRTIYFSAKGRARTPIPRGLNFKFDFGVCAAGIKSSTETKMKRKEIPAKNGWCQYWYGSEFSTEEENFQVYKVDFKWIEVRTMK
jgi:hypothetical protein